MGVDEKGETKFANSEWWKFIGIIAGHAIIVFGAILFWTNRIVKIETKVEGIEQTVEAGFTEFRYDIKTILRQTRESPPN